MTLEQYWAILLKQWKLVLVCFLFVGLGTFIGSKLMTPVYQSSALVQVAIRSTNNNQADYNNLMASDQLVQTEATLATSDPVLREAASHYSGLSAGQLAGEVSSTTRTNTQLFEIDVVDSNPVRAASIANSVATTLIAQQHQAIQQQDNQSQQQMQQDLDQTQKKINDITTQISDLQAKGGNSGQLALLQAQLTGLQQHYSQWQTALAQLELTQAQSDDFLQVAQPAQPTTSPVRPKVSLYTAGGLLAGLLLGLVLAVVYEQLDTRVRTPEALTQLLEWPVLTTIWQGKSTNREDVINPTGRDANVEPYRILRTSIGFSSIDEPLRLLAVTSAASGDGKSTIAANLAIFMAKAGKNTLLIDADLRRPTQHNLFSLTPDKLGLSNALLALSMPAQTASPQFLRGKLSGVSNTANSSLEPFIHSVDTPNLCVMPSGHLPPNPPEMFASKAMENFLSVLVNFGFEVVIFDTPSLLGLSDTSILASKVDGALIVVDTTCATKTKLKQVKAVLAQTGVRVLGCVANKQRHSHKDTCYYGAEDRRGNEKRGRSGHTPSGPASLMPVAPPFK